MTTDPGPDPGREMNRKKVPRRRHVPQRTCVICREKRDKRSLIRLVRTADAGVQIDPTGKQNGRGAYVCDRPECISRATTSDALAAALKTALTAAEKETLAAALARIR